MKKNYLLWLVMALFSVLPVDLQAQYGIVLEEGFEGGIVPPIWSQDNVEGSQSWVVERDGIYPTGAFEGEYRIAIKNPTSTTIGYRTKLISPRWILQASSVPY